MKKWTAGPASMLAGYVLFGFAPVFIRQARSYDWWVSHTLIARYGLAIVGILLLRRLFYSGVDSSSLKPANRRLLFWRAVFGGSAVLCYFAAIQLLGAAKGTLLNYTHSVFANLFAFLFLAHRPPKAYWPCLALALAGLWLVINPTFDGFSWPEAMGLFSGMLGGAAILTVKELRKTDHALTIFSAQTLGGLLFILPALALESRQGLWQMEGARLESAGWIALGMLALLSMVGQLFFTHGYRHTTVALGTVMSLITPLLATVCGWAFLGEYLGKNVIIGGFLIISGTLMTGIVENRSKDDLIASN